MKKFLSILVFSLILCQLCFAFTSKNLQVRIHNGKIIGRFLRSTSGRTIRAFMGIPYAAPPIGDLRFKSPQPVEPWFHKILYAQKEPPACSQVSFLDPSKSYQGQEDCLYLNVYTPFMGNISDSKARLPVMVWIHGGGWMFGHGGHSLYGPEYLLDQDVVLVSGNYRLGPLGFLSTEDENAPGNFGLKDQMAILEWVQQNIEKFGGDGNSVTIFGESAGGASVNYHMVSPLSKGLFHKAISQSGTLMNPWADPARKGVAKMRAVRLADLMGCPITGSSMKEMVKCLRQVPAENITMAMLEFYETHETKYGFDNDPVVPFPPIVEDFENSEEEAFITDLRFKKHSFDIPWITGITSDEGILKILPIITDNEKKKLVARKWENLIPLSFYYDHLHEDDILEINVKVYDFYFKEKFMDHEDINPMINLWSDGWFGGFVDNLEYRLRDNNRDNTWVYQFSHKGFVSFSQILNGGEKFYGTCHGDDDLYFFPPPEMYGVFESGIPSKQDEKLRKNWIKLWANFAKTGHPTPEWSSDSKFPFWTPATKFPLDYLLIGNENGKSKEIFKMEKDLNPERSKFWSELKEKYNLHVWKTDKPKTDSKDEL